MLKTWFSLYGLAVAVQLAHVLANDPKHPASQHTEADAPTPTNLLKRSSSANQRSAGEGATIPERRPDSQEGQQPQSLSSSSNRQQHEARSAQRRTSTFSASIASQPDLVYVLEHSSTVSGEQDTSNSAGIGIWSASNQGLYGVASQDQGYFINMNLGSPATNFKVQLDTSSADTWVASTACTDCGVNYGRRKAIGPSTSASLVANDTAAWTASYSPSYPVSGVDVALASAQGTMAKDLVIFGGGLSMENFPFGLATSVSDTFSASEIPFLGVLGLANSHAYPDLSMQNQEPPIMTLYKAGKIPRPQVGLALGRSASGSNTGQLAFGGVVPSMFSGDMVILESVSQEGYWEVPLEVTSSSGASDPLQSRTGIIDTRSAVMWASQADVIALFSGVEGAFLSDSSGLVLPCSSQLSLTLKMGTYSTELEARDLIFTPQESSTLCGSQNCCLSTIQPAPSSVGLQEGQWILGIPALRGTYIGFDYEENTIGLAAQI